VCPKRVSTHGTAAPARRRAGRKTFTVGALPRAFIGLGSNLGDRRSTLERALELLASAPGVALVATSTLRETDPVGFADQPRFLNGAALVETDLEPRALLDLLLGIERTLGRERGEGPRFGPRTVDLDLLLYADEEIDEPGLTVPHPRLAERGFALEPLVELDPDVALPGGRPLRELLGSLPPQG
jgi:2-amino-4-hydroxy-6-hydroxymethyldihydropteridine diphosphokinase